MRICISFPMLQSLHNSTVLVTFSTLLLSNVYYHLHQYIILASSAASIGGRDVFMHFQRTYILVLTHSLVRATFFDTG